MVEGPPSTESSSRTCGGGPEPGGAQHGCRGPRDQTDSLPATAGRAVFPTEEGEAAGGFTHACNMISDQGINPRRRYNHYKYICAQLKSISICKANTNNQKERK